MTTYFLFCVAGTQSETNTHTNKQIHSLKYTSILNVWFLYIDAWKECLTCLSSHTCLSFRPCSFPLTCLSPLTRLSSLLTFPWVSPANRLLIFLVYQPCQTVLLLAAKVSNNSKSFHQRYEQHILLMANDNEWHQSLTAVSETDIYGDHLGKYFKFRFLRLILKAQLGHMLSEAEAQHIHLDRAWHPTLSADHVAVACYLCHTETVQADND